MTESTAHCQALISNILSSKLQIKSILDDEDVLNGHVSTVLLCTLQSFVLQMYHLFFNVFLAHMLCEGTAGLHEQITTSRGFEMKCPH